MIFLGAVEKDDAVFFVGEIEAAGVVARAGLAVLKIDGVEEGAHVGEVVEAGFDEVLGLFEGVVDDGVPGGTLPVVGGVASGEEAEVVPAEAGPGVYIGTGEDDVG